MSDPIYIMTYRRHPQTTYLSLPHSLRRRAAFVTDKEDGRKIQRVHPEARIIRCPKQGFGGPVVRQWVLDYHQKWVQREGWASQLFIVLDDDIRFKSAHWEEGKKRFRVATKQEIVKGFKRLETKAMRPQVAFTSFGNTYFNDKEGRWALCKMVNCGAFFVNRKILEKTQARFDGISNRGDIQFMLMTWTAGYPSWNSMWFVADNIGSSGHGGEALCDEAGEMYGDAVPRSVRQEEAYKQLAKQYPKWVKLRHRPSPRNDDIGCPLDVTVYGMRAFKDNAKVEVSQ